MNFAVMAVLLTITALLGVNSFASGGSLNIGALAIFSLVVGFTGSFISLLLSKKMAKWSTRAQVIEQPQTPQEQWLIDTVSRFAQKAGIGMPEVAVYQGDANAFATGAFKNSALVAVSTGLLDSMTQEEVEAVIGHEVAHIANGDMVTMALLQGVLNTFVVFAARAIAFVVDQFLRGNEEGGSGIAYYVISFVLDLVFGVLAMMVAAWFSRKREFRADAGAAGLMGDRQPMIAALQRLGSMQPGALPKEAAAFGITGGIGHLFSTHPPMEKRIAYLQSLES